MDRLSHNAIELRYVDAIYELTNIQAIYNAHDMFEKAKELDDIIHALSQLRYDNYNAFLAVKIS